MTQPQTPPQTPARPAGLNAHRLRMARLDGTHATEFTLTPTGQERAWLAADLGISALPALRFRGKIRAVGREDWLLEARLSARVTQPCVVSLAPVTSTIDEDVTRRFTPHLPEPEGEEVEMPEDDSLDLLPATLDLVDVMAEALALALPQYPRSDAAGAVGEWHDADGGGAPEEARKPFAGLADLLSPRDSTSEG